MTVPVSAPACSMCGGEGFLFAVSEGKASAVACACTATCPQCHGAGRVYARDERDYEIMRGCACGADPRRLSLLTGLRLPPKFLDRTLGVYRAYSPSQQRALLRAGGNVSAAAKALGVSRATLHRKLKRFELNAH